MMSGHGGNPIFFNKKIEIGCPEHSLTPHPLTSDNILFLPYPPPPPQSRRHMCITPYRRPLVAASENRYFDSFCCFPLLGRPVKLLKVIILSKIFLRNDFMWKGSLILHCILDTIFRQFVLCHLEANYFFILKSFRALLRILFLVKL